MTPIQKAKEILDAFLEFCYDPELNIGSHYIELFLATPQAAALLSGEPRYLEFVEVDDTSTKIYFKENKKFLGYLFFVDSDWYWEASGTGGWSWYALKEISNELKRLNDLIPEPPKP